MRVGILGGGQLAQMLAQAGQKLGMEFMFLCPDPQACAAPFGEHLSAAFDDERAINRIAEWSEVITYEFENVPVELVTSLEQRAILHPNAKALEIARDRLLEKGRFQSLGIPTATSIQVDTLADLETAVGKIGLPAILKTRTQGYDGKGQAVLNETTDLAGAWNQVGQVPCIVESMVGFERELSIIAARDRAGAMVFYPLSENHHREGVLRLSLSQHNDPLQPKAEQLISSLMEDLDYVGVLALELFQVGNELYANEMAPRVHNTGHWTIDGSQTSQFENHLRAVSGMPLGATDVPARVAMINLVGQLPSETAIREVPGAVPHFYGKAVRTGRKVGHINLVDQGDGEQLFSERIRQLLELAGEHQLMAQFDS